MNAGKPHGSGLLGALLSGDSDTLVRMAQQAAAKQAQAALQHSGVEQPPRIRQAADGIDIPDSVREAVRDRQLVVAVREMRAANPGLDLATANRIVRKLAQEVAVNAGEARSQASLALAKAKRPPTVAPGDRGGVRAVVYALALAGGALAWWMFAGS